jgi:polyisoprenoid-binding protein YceI
VLRFTGMIKIKYLLLASLMFVLSAFAVFQSNNWKIEGDYSVVFFGAHANGCFEKIKGDIRFSPDYLETSNFNIKVDVGSIKTGNRIKNKHAKSDKWFDAEKYPNIEFQSTCFFKTPTGYLVKGIMKMHGIEKEMSIPFTFVNNVFESHFSVNRLDFEVGTLKGMMKNIAKEIKLQISVPVTIE